MAKPLPSAAAGVRHQVHPIPSGKSLRRKSEGDGAPSVQGQVIGYARVSTSEQSVLRQVAELTEAGASRVFTDEGVSGAVRKRPGLDDALNYLRPGDVLAVVELSRLGRSTAGVVELIDDLRARDVEVTVLNVGLDTRTSTGRLVLSILAAVAEMERELIAERVRSGVANARRQGKHCGRPAALTQQQRRVVVELHANGRSNGEVATIFGCSERTIRRVLAQEIVTDGVPR